VNWIGSDKPDEFRRIGCGNRHTPASRGDGQRARQRTGSRCRWYVRMRRIGDEWSVYRACWEHNHPLFLEEQGLSSRAGLRSGIPEDLLLLGRQLRHAGTRAGRINDVLCCNASIDMRPITWNLEDVRRAFMPTYSDRSDEQHCYNIVTKLPSHLPRADGHAHRCSDATGLCAWLSERDEAGLPTFVDIDEEGCLCACGFVLAGAQVLVDSYGDDVLTIIDSTHNKTRFGLRLYSISSITQNGTTKVRLRTHPLAPPGACNIVATLFLMRSNSNIVLTLFRLN
jgi:hypothetical protein